MQVIADYRLVFLSSRLHKNDATNFLTVAIFYNELPVMHRITGFYFEKHNFIQRNMK